MQDSPSGFGLNPLLAPTPLDRFFSKVTDVFPQLAFLGGGGAGTDPSSLILTSSHFSRPQDLFEKSSVIFFF